MLKRSTPAPSSSRRRLAALLAGASVLLAACGGGIYIGGGGGDDYWYDDNVRPNVSMAAPATATAGSTITLSAAASDDWSGIDQVAFYRVDGSNSSLIASDRSSPYQTSFAVPNDGRTFVDVYALAIDRAGNERESAVVRITIAP